MPAPAEQAQDLRRTIWLRTATAIVIGSVIGSGVFKKAAAMTDALPSPLLVLGIWVLAAGVTFAGALCSAELTAACPKSGGLYAQLREALGDLAGFMYGWSVLTVIQTGSIASIAYVFAQYLRYFLHWGDLPQAADAWGVNLWGVIDLYPLRDLSTKLVAVALILGLTATNVAGVRLGALVQDSVTGLKLLAIAAILAIAAFGAGDISHVTAPPLLPDGMTGIALAGGVTIALSGAFWAYDGWINVTYLGSELRRPERNVPLAMLLGLGVITAVYLSVNVAYYYLLDVAAIRSSDLVAADALSVVLPKGAALASAAVVLSTFGTVNGTVMASARVCYAMARDRVFFAPLGAVHRRFETPHVALVVQGIWSSVLVFSGTFDQITDMLIFVSWGFYGLLAVAVLVHRARFPLAARPYRVPGYPVLPIVFSVFCAAFLVLSILQNTRNALFGLLFVLPGIPTWWLFRRAAARKAAESTGA